MRFQNGFNKVLIELRVVQFWSEIILVHVISNRTRAARSFDFEITRMISDQIALHSVQLPLFMTDSLSTAVPQPLMTDFHYDHYDITVIRTSCFVSFTSTHSFHTDGFLITNMVVRAQGPHTICLCSR